MEKGDDKQKFKYLYSESYDSNNSQNIYDNNHKNNMNKNNC